MVLAIVTVAGVERLTLPELTQRVLDSKSDTRKVTHRARRPAGFGRR